MTEWVVLPDRRELAFSPLWPFVLAIRELREEVEILKARTGDDDALAALREENGAFSAQMKGMNDELLSTEKENDALREQCERLAAVARAGLNINWGPGSTMQLRRAAFETRKTKPTAPYPEHIEPMCRWLEGLANALDDLQPGDLEDIP